MQRRFLVATIVGLLAAGFPAVAQTPATLSGPPVLVQPYAPEPGVPLITVSPGTANPFAGGTATGGATANNNGGADGIVTASINNGALVVERQAAGSTGSSGSFVAVNYSQYLGQSVGSGQCAVLVEAADPSVGVTATGCKARRCRATPHSPPALS